MSAQGKSGVRNPSERWIDCYRLGRELAAQLPRTPYFTEEQICRELGFTRKQQVHWFMYVTLGKVALRLRRLNQEKPDEAGLSPEQVRSAVAPFRAQPKSVTRSRPPTEAQRRNWNAENARRRRDIMLNLQPVCEISDKRLMEIVLKVAGERPVPTAAILSRSRIQEVADARREVWRRALAMGLLARDVARQFDVKRSAISHGGKARQ